MVRSSLSHSHACSRSLSLSRVLALSFSPHPSLSISLVASARSPSLSLFAPIVLHISATHHALSRARVFLSRPCSGGWSGAVGQARSAGWFFPEFQQTKFWQLWAEMYGGLTPGEPFGKRVVLPAITGALGDLTICILMASIDMLGKQVGTKNLLQMQSLSLESESILAGLYNLPLALIGGAPAYSQLKFNVLNYAIIHSKTSSIAGIVCALFNGYVDVPFFSLSRARSLSFSLSLSLSLSLSVCDA